MPRGAGASVIVLASCLAAMVGPCRGQAQGDEPTLTIGPALLRGSSRTVGGIRVGLEYSSASSDFLTLCGPKESLIEVGADVPVAWDARLNPETIRADVRLGYEKSLYCVREAPDDADPEADLVTRNLGYLAVELRAAVEAPQDMDLADVSFGGTVIYEHDRYQELWWVPEVRASLDGVACVSCDVSGQDDRTVHGRVDAALGWNVPFDRSWIPGLFRPLWLRPRGRGFWSFAMSEGLSDQRGEDGLWGSAELGYRVDRSSWLHEIYVRWSGGEIPVALGEESAWTVGASLVL